jgi:hypothetical protein
MSYRLLTNLFRYFLVFRYEYSDFNKKNRKHIWVLYNYHGTARHGLEVVDIISNLRRIIIVNDERQLDFGFI